MPADIILYALVAAGLVFWLRSLLGTRSGDEPRRPNPFAETSETGAAANSSGRPSAAGPVGLLPEMPADTIALERHMSIADAAQPGLMDIVRADRGFSAGRFLAGAQDAFVMIVEAFAQKDRETLQNLLAPSVLNAFLGAIEERDRSGQKASVEIHAVRRAEILNAWVDNRMAYVTVKFIADETNVLSEADGRLIHGHPDRVTETVDIWTFGRDTRSRHPAWLVHETRDEDAAAQGQDAARTVPDAENQLG